MLTLAAQPAALIKCQTHRFCTLWKIERTDSTILYFTDHDHEITYSGNTYTPTGGFNASAVQKQGEGGTQNLEIVGALSSSAITHADLRAGRYHEAKVTAYLVDWHYPWAGAFETSVFWISEVRYTGEDWEARVEGYGRWLRPRIGKLYARTCWHTLGDTACGINLNLSAWKESGTVDDVTSGGLDDRRVFSASGLTKADDFFNRGYITWSTGSNAALISEVKDWTLSTTKIELQLPTKYPIAVSDTFAIRAGCDKLASTCKDTFSNLVNFGGFPTIPGDDKAMQTPLAK
jgi:uncharacterized phage protein (TIGR02218 family)